MNKSPLAVALEIIRLEPLTVSEGENTLLSSAHISLVLDAARYGVRESGVMFHIYSPPTHGTLHLEIWEHDAHAGQMFTLLDLAKDKVRYIHDGSESRLDSFQCEVALSPGPGFLLPSYLQGRHRFRFHIQITPVNDPPTLTIPQTRVLRLAQGTRKTLSSDLLLASDLDSSPADLVFSVNQSESSMGHLERDHVTTLSFTQEELSQGRVQYVHTGNSTGNFKLALQVRLAAHKGTGNFKLALQVVEGGQERLSGSIVCHGVSSLSYRVTRPPRHGRLDLTEAVTSKKIIARDISRFSGAQLSRSLILYSHDDSESRSDRVEFVAVSSDKEDFQYIGSISISVALTNDNAPRRSSNHSVELVTGSSHLVLPSHLSYADEDTDATPHNIIYSVRSSEGGALYSAVKQTDRPLSEFSQ
ncbi:chondroitin sulfate proteoglycan 4-like, partial [Diaphorina citri]|uniref:Chondroitin sulfate proteoglycan 4-like n=1 Tax=Diaphorina citri TaxID=121845 RepID=A0A3Q0ITV4_DIACI